jgi:hypothetical protein
MEIKTVIYWLIFFWRAFINDDQNIPWKAIKSARKILWEKLAGTIHKLHEIKENSPSIFYRTKQGNFALFLELNSTHQQCNAKSRLPYLPIIKILNEIKAKKILNNKLIKKKLKKM